jgi:N-acetylneuraminic acid mutarotase
VPAADPPAYPDLPVAVSSFAAAVAGDYVYAFGGHSGPAHTYAFETTLGEFHRLRLTQAGQWERLPSGPRLQGLALVAHRGKLYRLGGMQPHNSRTEKTDTRSLAGCAFFDPAGKQWLDLEPLPEPRSSHDAVVLGNALYVFGGWRLNGKEGKAEWHAHGLRLDLSSRGGKWDPVPQPFRRRALTATAHAGKVYVIGGLTEAGKVVRTVDVFDPTAGTWDAGPPLPGEDSHGFSPASAVQGGRLYVATADGKVYRLAEAGDGWVAVGQLSAPRFVARMLPGPAGRLLIVGGAAPTGLLASVEVIEPHDG